MKGFLSEIMGLSLLRLLMDLLLPDGDRRRYADFGVGLCLTLCMLQALRRLIRGAM